MKFLLLGFFFFFQVTRTWKICKLCISFCSLLWLFSFWLVSGRFVWIGWCSRKRCCGKPQQQRGEGAPNRTILTFSGVTDLAEGVDKLLSNANHLPLIWGNDWLLESPELTNGEKWWLGRCSGFMSWLWLIGGLSHVKQSFSRRPSCSSGCLVHSSGTCCAFWGKDDGN